MALPAGWPAPQCSGRRSGRFYKNATATTNFSDSAYLFTPNTTVLPTVEAGPMDGTIESPGTTIPPTPQGDPTGYFYVQTIWVKNDGSAILYISFDGTNIHGELKSGEERIYRNRFEGGISFKAATGTCLFRCEAW